MKNSIIDFEVLVAYLLIAAVALLIKPFSFFRKRLVQNMGHLDKPHMKS